MPRNLKIDSSILEAALIGYQHQRDAIDARIAEIRRQIDGEPPQASASEADAPTKRVVGAAGRKRMAAAQRKRWAEIRARQAAAEKAARKPTATRRAAKRSAAK
jgi:hypothetical protein